MIATDVEQRTKQLETDVQAIKNVLQRMSRLQVENTQAISELTFQVTELSRSVNTFVATVSFKQTHYKEKVNKFVDGKRTAPSPNKPTRGVQKTEARAMREQLDSMCTQLQTLMAYLEESKHE